MCQKYTADELNTMNHDAKNAVIYQMQERLDKLADLVGQLSFFNEVEACYDEVVKEPTMEEVTEAGLEKPRKQKKRGQREEDIKNFPQEVIPHDVSEKKLMSSRCMSEPMDFIRMSSFVETIREPCSAAELPQHRWKRPSLMQSM